MDFSPSSAVLQVATTLISGQYASRCQRSRSRQSSSSSIKKGGINRLFDIYLRWDLGHKITAVLLRGIPSPAKRLNIQDGCVSPNLRIVLIRRRALLQPTASPPLCTPISPSPPNRTVAGCRLPVKAYPSQCPILHPMGAMQAVALSKYTRTRSAGVGGNLASGGARRWVGIKAGAIPPRQTTPCC